MTVAVLLVALLSMVSFMSAVSPAMADSAPTGFPAAGDTIRINSHGDLVAAKVAYGWNGTGTAIDPIIIDGTKGDPQIDMNGAAVGLYIANITIMYFEIKNWTINNTANNGIGIEVLSVRTAFSIHGVVVNNTQVGIYLNLTTNAQVYGCVLFNCEQDVLVERSLSSVVRDNAMHYTGLTAATTRAVHFFRVVNGAINNNQITDIKNPILTEYCFTTTIGHNDILNCTLGLFNNQGSERTFIHNNTFVDVVTRAVHLNFDSNNATLVDNVFKNVTATAVFLTDDNDVRLKNNTFNNCALGIGANAYCLRMTIDQNIFNNCDRGINLNETTYGAITYNAFLGSASYGVSLLYNATKISVHHNVFKDCNAGGIQAFDFVDGQNLWNDSNFGNYWNDHTVPGLHDTGISDTPYLLAGGGQVDMLPLTYTIGPVGNLDAEPGAGPKILLIWDASNYSAGSLLSSPESHYVVYRTGGGDPEKKWTIDIGIDSLIDSTVSPGNTYTYSVRGNNTYGDSGNRSVIISTAAGNVPVVNITSPGTAAIFATATIPVTWEGWGNGSAITLYEIRLDAGGWTSKGTTTSHTFTSVSDGAHVITVRVTNAALITGFDVVNVIVDTQAPSLTITSPIEGYRTGSGSITVAWTGTDSSSGIKNYSLRVDGGAWKNENLATSDVVTGLQNGTHTFEVRAFDNAGHNVTKKVNATVDRAAPVVAIIAPMDGLFTNSMNFTASWNVTDATGENSTWARLINTSGIPLAWHNVTGESSIWITDLTQNKTLLVDGAWQLIIASNDMLDNNGTTVSHFTVDTMSPAIAIVKPSSGSFNNTGLVTVEWSATDINLGQIEYRVGTGNWTNVGLNGSQSLDLTDGTYVVQVRATDKAGNSATASVTIIVDMVPPVISNIDPVNGSFVNEDVPTFTWDVSDSSSGINNTMVSLDGIDVYIGLNKSYTAPSALAQGQHTFNITVWDNASNMQTMSIIFYVDLTTPEVVILNPIEGGYYNSTTVVAAWLGTDPSGIAYFESRLDSEAWQFMGAATVRSLTLGEGAHTFSVRAYDNASNIYTTSVSFVVDLTAPLLAIESPSEGAMFASTGVAVAWTGYDGLSGIQGYSISIDGLDWIEVEDNMSYMLANLSDGVHTASVRAMDVAGNYVIMEVSFTTDVTSPYVIIETPENGSMFADGTVFIDWTLVDNTTGLWYWWTWVDDNAPLNATDQPYYTWGGLTEGNHVIHVKAWDLVGNAQEKSVSVLTDLNAPAIVITSPADQAHLASRTVTVNFDVTDTASGLKEIFVKLGSSANWESVGTNGTYTFTVVSDTSTTPYTFLVMAVDNVGHNATSQVQFFVDTATPNIVSSVPASGANGVLRSSQIVVDFNEAMLASSVTITTSPTAIGSYLWNSAFTQVIFTPSTGMAYASVYTANVAGTDLAGNALSGTTSFSFTTIAHVTGIVKDQNGNVISGATINMTHGTSHWNAVSGEDGGFAIDVPTGTYNLTVSASGKKDFVRNDVAVTTGTNELGDLGMSPQDNWTWLIVVVIVVIIALGAIYFLYMRKKPEEAKPEEKPKSDEEPKGKT